MLTFVYQHCFDIESISLSHYKELLLNTELFSVELVGVGKPGCEDVEGGGQRHQGYDECPGCHVQSD